MTEFVGYTTRQKAKFIFMFLVFVILGVCLLCFGLVEIWKGKCSNMSLGSMCIGLMFIPLVFMFIKQEGNILNKFKIENNYLIIKKFTKTISYNLNKLEAIYYQPGLEATIDYFFYFGSKLVIFPYYDGNEFFKYFFEKKYLEAFNRRLPEIENSKRYYHKKYIDYYRKFLVFRIFGLLFLAAGFCFVILEMFQEKEYLYFMTFVLLVGVLVIYGLVVFIKTHTKKARYAAKNEYIDKDGIHTVEKFIPFSEIVDAERIVNKWFRQDIKLKTNDGEFLIPGKYIINDLFYGTYFAQKAVESSETKL